MPLGDSHLYSAVRVIGLVDPNRDSETKGVIGTGFMMDVTTEREDGATFHHRYVITAAHVLEDQYEVQVLAQRRDGQFGQAHTIKRSAWKSPLKDFDVAVAPWDEFLGIGISLDMMRRDPLALGTTMNYVGILTALGKPLPMVRSGTIAALDVEGLKLNGGYSFPAHLIDCRSYDGFSGSPCYSRTLFVIGDPLDPLDKIKERFPLHGSNLERAGAIAMSRTGSHIEFIGMFTNHTTDEFDARGGGVINRYGIGVMLRSEDIRRALLSPEIENDRLQEEARLLGGARGEPN